jgi:hypothetical protein
LVVWTGVSVFRSQAAISFSFAKGIAPRKSAWGFAEAPAALKRSTIIVFDQPGVEIDLQLVERTIDLLAERDTVERLEDGAMEALADTPTRLKSGRSTPCDSRMRLGS